MSRIGFFLFWLLNFLPEGVLVRLGRALGAALHTLMPERRHIALINLSLCFPEKSDAERTALVREHYALIGRTLLERPILYWGSPERIRRMVRLEGLEHFDAVAGRPIILYSIHMAGMEVGWFRLTMERVATGFYARMKNPYTERKLLALRTRFLKNSPAVTSKDGIKAALDVIRSGTPMYYLPDMDFGRKHSLFIPFFSVLAASLPSLSRMAAETGAAIVPIIPHLTPEGWVVTIEPAWENFPTGDLVADTRRMNAHVEGWVRRYPAQYWWTHKRFKTRPEGEKSPY